MKARWMVSALVFCVMAVTAAVAQESIVGTWKLNEAKSKIPAGASKNTTIMYAKEGDDYKVVLDGVDAAGKTTHSDWIGKFDGKDYPVKGDERSDARSYTKVDDYHLKAEAKKAGKVVLTADIETTQDGRTRTVKSHWKDKNGKAQTATFIYDKQ